jgi:hypothetical protein
LEPAQSLGLALLARAATDGPRTQALWDMLVGRVTASADDVGAILDLAMLLLATGNREKGLELQAAAIAQQPCYRRAAEGPRTLRVLAFVTAGDFTANTPLDFMLEGSSVDLLSYYVDGPPSAADTPEHDVAFLAIGESEAAAPLLAKLDGAFEAWPRPVLNNQPRLIADLTRDGVAARFTGSAHVLCPPTGRVDRAALARIAAAEQPVSSILDGLAFPIIARPVGTHAGIGMERLADPSALAAYLAEHLEPEFYVTAFCDYSGPDGLFRKLRIVFIGGRPFLSHMAVSERWMVHYLNADMAGSEANRADEARMMATFDEDFALRHGPAFAELNAAFPLDYYGIDCAEAPDGRLLVFEVDVAMIVHAMDPVELYPYKQPAMAKLFAAFVGCLESAAAGVPGRQAGS